MNKPANKLVVEDLHLAYGDNQILKGVSMTLNPGEVVALLGASGSGKTTLLRSVAGLEQPSRGKIAIGDAVLFDGAAGVDMPVEKRNLGLVFQSYALWPHRTVFENVAYGLRLRGTPGSELDERVTQALANLGLDHLAQRLPHQLSGGQQQRVAIARALVYNPPVVLMDEPLSNLDAKLREEARAWLRELIVRLGLSALVVTHDQTEAMAMSDKILLLNFGQIEQQGTPDEMYNKPQTQFTAEFMGSNNRLPGNDCRGREWTRAARRRGLQALGRASRQPQGRRQGDRNHPARADEDDGLPRRKSRRGRARHRDVHGRPPRALVQARRAAPALLRRGKRCRSLAGAARGRSLVVPGNRVTGRFIRRDRPRGEETMGLLDGILGKTLGGATSDGGAPVNPLLQIALQLLQQNGGVAGVLDKFRQGGYADQADSWQSTGENLPISGSALQEVLGSGTIGQIAAQLGLSHGEAAREPGADVAADRRQADAQR